MKRTLVTMALSALLMGISHPSQAVELLISGNFENPGGATGEVPFWTLSETVTGSSASVDSAQIDGPLTDSVLWLKPFAGGTGLGTAQGNFDGDGDVDGRDFLTWQRGGSPTALSTADLTAWQNNYPASGGANKVNARLIQVVPAVAGDTYTFEGTALFEDFYSGLVTTLGDASPFAGQASPTVTRFRMEFLNASSNVIGSPFITDLRPIVTFPGFYTPASVSALSPAGATSVRVVAEALDMVWNGSSTQETPGNTQSAFFNDFKLTRASAPTTQLLENGDLNLGTPSALDFWNQVETPATRTEILRTASFANHTPGGTLGVWYSAFFGAHPNFEPDPVSGSISQTIQADAGDEFNFSGWSRFEGGYSGGVDIIDPTSTGFFAGQASPTETTIKLEFLDISEAVISESVIDVEAARKALGGGVANDNQWRQHFFNGAIAPAGTEFVKISANMTNAVFNKDVGGALGNQSIFFDDFTLDGPGGLITLFAVPEPGSMALLGLALASCGLCRGGRRS